MKWQTEHQTDARLQDLPSVSERWLGALCAHQGGEAGLKICILRIYFAFSIFTSQTSLITKMLWIIFHVFEEL